MACLIYTCTCTFELCIPFQIKLPKADGPLCQICELAVSFLKPYVDSNATEVNIHVHVCHISLYVHMCVDVKHMYVCVSFAMTHSITNSAIIIMQQLVIYNRMK